MTNIYKGNTPELYKLFLEGKQLQYQAYPECPWLNIPKYNGKPDDIHRVSNEEYYFREAVITKVYTHYDGMEEMVKNGNFYARYPNNMLFDNNAGMDEHLEFTFTNGKLTKVEMKGPTT